MGTSYKGDSPTYRSIGENLGDVRKEYTYSNGYFGIKGQGRTFTRNISSDNPVQDAKNFYDKFTYGGIEKSLKNGKGKTTKLADGSIITYREISTSDGTSVVEINVKDSKSPSGIKYQKIHFIQK